MTGSHRLTNRLPSRYIEGGSLGTTLKSFGQLNEKLVAGYAAKIIEGLDYLHKQGAGIFRSFESLELY